MKEKNMKYILTENTTHLTNNVSKGTVVYECTKNDYGCSSDDTRGFGEEYISCTLSPAGDYPFFTVPARILESYDILKNEFKTV